MSYETSRVQGETSGDGHCAADEEPVDYALWR
jgi:hypothetical protein